MAQTHNRADKILVLDDDARIRDLLRRYLTQEGFEVILAEDSKALNRIMMRDSVDLIVLDLMMPGEDGLSICRRLRAANDRTPIIMLTAKGEDVDRIVGLEVGADDYLAKPFNPRELLARIHAVLRRRPPVEVPGAPSSDQEVVKFGPFSFDMGLRTLQKNGEELPLTTGEFAMLKTLVRHPRQPLSLLLHHEFYQWTRGLFAAPGRSPQDVAFHTLGLDSVVAGVEDALVKERARTDGKRAARDARAAELQKLVEAQRGYYRAVADMTAEATANEQLQQALQQRGAGAGAGGAARWGGKLAGRRSCRGFKPNAKGAPGVSSHVRRRVGAPHASIKAAKGEGGRW